MMWIPLLFIILASLKVKASWVYGDYHVVKNLNPPLPGNQFCNGKQGLVSLLLSILHESLVSEGSLSPDGHLIIELAEKQTPSEGNPCFLSNGTIGTWRKITDCAQDFEKQVKLIQDSNKFSLLCCTKNGSQTSVSEVSRNDTQLDIRQNPQQIGVELDVKNTTLTGVRINFGERSKQACENYFQALKNNMVDSVDCEEFYYDGPGVVGGEPANPREFPHMAALGYGDGNAIAWQCGGSLISSRYVLTAAHCLSTRNNGPVRQVRLGDLDLFSTTDDAQPQQFTVEDTIIHPDYKPPALYNDIALLRLDRDVEFNMYVRPCCLNIDVDLLDNVADVTGWGLVNWAAAAGSSHLMKATLPVQPAEECFRNYKSLHGSSKLRNGFDDDTMLCVGDEQGEMDTCKGDSGGPYHKQPTEYPKCLHVIAGITSFGKTVCGAVNSPAVYTRVSKFVPWIEDIVWPGN